MSSEVVKKRGRPRKVVSDPVESELAETIKKPATTRAKSTKAPAAAPKPKTAKSTASAKPSTAAKPIPKPKTVVAASPSPKVASKPSTPAVKKAESKAPPAPPPAVKKSEPQAPPPAPAAIKTEPEAPSPALIDAAGKKLPITPETSKILSKVRELSQEQNSRPTQKSTPSSEPPAAATTSPSAKSPSKKPTSPSKFPSAPKPIASSPPPPPSNPKPPIAALNSAIVSNITTRAGARPNASGSQQLPSGYKSVARKVTMAIVAMPIMIVTSWVLYDRLVLGNERKLLVKPVSPEVDAGKEGKDVVSPTPKAE